MTTIYLPPRQRNSLGEGLGGLAGLFAGRMYKSKMDQARAARAQEILSRYERSLTGAPEAPTIPDQGGQGNPLLQAITSPFRALSPTNIAEYMMGPMPTDIGTEGEALSAVARTGLPETEMATYGKAIQDARRRKSSEGLISLIERSAPGTDLSSLRDASNEEIGLAVDALRLGATKGQRPFELFVNTPDGPMKQKAVYNSDGSVDYIGDPIPAWKPGTEQSGMFISVDPSGRVEVGYGPGGKAAQTAGGTYRGRRQAELESTIRPDMEEFGRQMWEMDQKIAKTARTPGGAIGKAGSWLDAAATSAGVLADRLGVPVPNLADVFGEDLPGEIGTLNAQQQAALLPLATVYARLNDPGGGEPSREELRAAMEAVKPVVMSGSPTQGRAALREIYASILSRTNAQLRASDVEEVVGDSRLLGSPQEEISQEELDDLRAKGMVVPWQPSGMSTPNE